MAHEHHHHHHGPAAAEQSLKNTYIIAIVLNLGFVAIEAVMGIIYNSLGLLSDAGHNLSDVVSLILALVALALMASKSRKGYTYGFQKSSVLISFVNALLLLVAVGVIVFESIEKIVNPTPIVGEAISWTAGAGILINGLTTYLLMRKQDHDLNSKGAYLHMLADTLVSVGVVISGIVISVTGWDIIDPVIGLVIAAIILGGTWGLLKESVRMCIDAVPEGIDEQSVMQQIQSVNGVCGVDEIHIWPVSTTETALTAHIRVEDIGSSPEIIREIKVKLAEESIRHSTIEVSNL